MGVLRRSGRPGRRSPWRHSSESVSSCGVLRGLATWCSPSVSSFKNQFWPVGRWFCLAHSSASARARASAVHITLVADIGDRRALQFRAPRALGAQHGGVDRAGTAIGFRRQGRRPALANFGTAERRLRSVDGLHDIEQRNLVRRAREAVSAVRTGNGSQAAARAVSALRCLSR